MDWHWASESVLCMSLPPPPDVMTQRRLLAMAAALRGTPGLLAVVPGLHNLSLLADLTQIGPQALEQLAQAAWRRARPWREALRERTLPVRYDGPDLGEAAAHAGLTEAGFIELHAAPRYEVACLGFLPGFPYLLGLPKRLAQPRLATPRARVPAGSVGIGGAQTGVYPQESPGGWRLIGSTTQWLYRAGEAPWLLPGDALRFEPLP
jgi:5-oxoprolinase (ATP-hydrolysing) subunit B